MLQIPRLRSLAVVVAATAIAACTSTTPNPNLPQGTAAYNLIPAKAPATDNYVLTPTDIIAVSVFGEDGLGNPQLRVDDNGFIQLPLVGQIKAAGLTAQGLSQAIAANLGQRYLVNPEVTVSVVAPAKRIVSVEGEVKTPGVYEIDQNFTLLSAIARAQSPTPIARLDEVIIFRTIDGQRMAARFNLKDIRSGVAADPEIMNGDVVTVGMSGIKSAWQDVLRAAPIFNAFVILGTK